MARMKNEKLLIYLQKIAMIVFLPTRCGSGDVLFCTFRLIHRELKVRVVTWTCYVLSP